jgi:hypothetical protein
MKKILLLCSIIFMYCCQAYAQTLTATPSSVTSGGTITVKASGESLSSNIFNLGGTFLSLSVAAPNQGYTSDINGSVVSGTTTYYNTGTTAPTTFQFKPTSSAPVPVVVTYTIFASVRNLTSTDPPTNVNLTFTVTINPPTIPSVFYNVAKSQVFYNNTCAAGYASDPYTYTVAAHTYSSTVSQADADSKAQAAINANGQNTANANAPCKIVYYNDAQSGTFTRNNCGVGSNGSSVVYTIAAHTYPSTVSIADANQKAINALNANGQAYANTNGSCSIVTYARIEVSNITSKHTNIPGSGGSHAHGFTDETTGDVYVKLYANAACTQPLTATSAINILVVLTHQGTTIAGGSNNYTTNYTYNVAAGASSYFAGRQTLDFDSSDDNGSYQYTEKYDVTTSGNTYVPETSYYIYQ